MIALNDKTALLFDAGNQTARLVTYDGKSLDPVYRWLNCDLVDTIRLDRDHIIFVDDEGLWKDQDTGFRITYNNRTVKFVGSGLLVGDMMGNTAPIKLNFSDLDIEVIVYERPEA
jgi:hypothetical protein